jgi:hypothetical protein
VFSHHAPGADGDIIANGNARQYYAAAPDPDIFPNGHRSGLRHREREPAAFAPVHPFARAYWVENRVDVDSGGNQGIIADGYLIAVKKYAIHVYFAIIA